MPDGADELDQRSILVAPLIAQQRLLGYFYVDIDGAFGRFHDTDRDLLGMLAAQAAVALDNAQWSQGLEQKVAQRTEELQTSNALLEQRAAELAIINAVQQALAGELSMQGVTTRWAKSCARYFPARSWAFARTTVRPASRAIRTPTTTTSVTSSPTSPWVTRASAPTSCAPARRSSSMKAWTRQVEPTAPG